MYTWIQSHGLEVLIAYFVFTSAVDSMPPLPEGAGYFARWAHGAAHAISGNWKNARAILKNPGGEQ